MGTEIETGTDQLQAWSDGHVGVLAFDRPERRNAFTPAMFPAITIALDAFEDDADVRVVMVTGRGGAFCAGGDVKAMNQANIGGPNERAGMTFDETVEQLRERQRAVSLRLHEFRKPVVAAIDGAAAGAGMSIALSADLRIASPRAFIVTAFSSIGASGDFGGSWFLARLLGEAKAKELYFRSPRIEAKEALEMGLVNELIDGEDFEGDALAWCAALAERAPMAMAKIKENVNRASIVDLASALDAEALNMRLTMSSNDHKEAAAAFVEKRTAVFHGN